MKPEPHVASYWLHTAGPEPPGLMSLRGDRTAEVAVIGGGYTGLAAAYRLAGTYGIDTVVLEAHRVGWGASGRNGGFVSPALSKVGLDDRIRKWGLDAARRSILVGLEAVETVRELIASEGIACDPQPAGYVLVAHRRDLVEELKRRQALYRDTLGYGGVEFLDRVALERGGHLRGPSAHGGLRLTDAFGLNPMKYVRGLAAAAIRRGAMVYDDSSVLGWTRGGGWQHLATANGTVRARKVIVATNGHTSPRLHPFFRDRLMPATSNIIVTRPLTADEWREVGMLTREVYADTRMLVFYWRRLPDDRMLFGGRAGVVDTPSRLRHRRRWLEARMAEKFPILRDVGSEYFWHGSVCLAYDLTPHVGRVDDDPNVLYAMAYMGSGVALATYCGGLVADLAAGKEVQRDTPLTSAGLPRFPLAFLRSVYLASAYVIYGIKDRWL